MYGLPGEGKVFAKPGTNGRTDLLNGRLIQDQADAGYLEVSPGRFYVFDVIVNNAVAQDINGFLKMYDEVATIAAFLQEDAVR